MTDDYVRAKINDALAVTENNRRDAQKLLITWAMRDREFLLRITKPHLKAITAVLIDHIMRANKDSENADQGPDFITRTAIDDIVASASRRGGLDKRKNSNLPPPKSTERQANTMRKLAAAFTKKKK